MAVITRNAVVNTSTLIGRIVVRVVFCLLQIPLAS